MLIEGISLGDLLIYFYQLDASKETGETPDWEKFALD